MEFYIYGYIGLFIIICGVLGYLILSKPKAIDIRLGDSVKRGGFNNVPGMRSNLSKKHKKRIY
jgi:hypothetical protein